MFKERDMSEAIEWLFSMYDDEDYEWQGEDEDAPDFVSILCLPQVCNALRDIAQTVYQYEVNSSYEKGFKYRGQELFGQRACLVCSEIDQAVMDSVSTYYENELSKIFLLKRSVLEVSHDSVKFRHGVAYWGSGRKDNTPTAGKLVHIPALHEHIRGFLCFRC